jgi:hypothetical protein
MTTMTTVSTRAPMIDSEKCRYRKKVAMDTTPIAMKTFLKSRSISVRSAAAVAPSVMCPSALLMPAISERRRLNSV